MSCGELHFVWLKQQYYMIHGRSRPDNQVAAKSIHPIQYQQKKYTGSPYSIQICLDNSLYCAFVDDSV
jgi:hypothetical protein